jgi:hypothetical protein
VTTCWTFRNAARHSPGVGVQGSLPSVQVGPSSQDLLSQVLRELRLDSATFRSLLLRGEWSLRFDGPLRGVHIIVSGHPQLALDEARRTRWGRATSSYCLEPMHTR